MDGYDLSQIPAVSPPAGVVSNFVNPPTQEQWPKITTYVTLPLVVLSLSLRLYARVKVTGFGFDDCLCFSAAASVIVYIALAFRVIEQAAGPHMWDIPVSKITVSYAKNTTTLALMYFVAAMFIKASLLALYKRIFRPSKQANRVLWGGIIVSTVFHITCIAVYLGLCLPRPEDEASGGWLSPQFAARTYSVEGALSAASGIIAAVIDLFILVTPLWLLWKLHMPSKRKAGVSTIFIAGSAACVFSIAGAVYRMKISSPTAEGQDLSWNVMPIYAMNIAEVNIGIVCSCMPVVFILFRGLSAKSANWSAIWISKIKNFTTSRRRTSAPSDGSEVHIFDDQSIEPKVLPGEPQVMWKEPKSCGHNLSRITSIPAQDIPPELLTVNSTEGDYYHAQLKRDAVPRGSHWQHPN